MGVQLFKLEDNGDIISEVFDEKSFTHNLDIGWVFDRAALEEIEAEAEFPEDLEEIDEE